MPDTSVVPVTGLREAGCTAVVLGHCVWMRRKTLMPIRKLDLQIHSNSVREDQGFPELKAQNHKIGEEE